MPNWQPSTVTLNDGRVFAWDDWLAKPAAQRLAHCMERPAPLLRMVDQAQQKRQVT